MGDPHGALKAIKQVLKRAGFNFKEDTLIVLGDVADGWPDVAESFLFLIAKVHQLIYVRGNHDQWLKEWLEFGRIPSLWILQGGENSIKSYTNHPDFYEISKLHLKFLKKTPCYHLDDKNRLFVHGGVDLSKPIEKNEKRYLMCDRALWEARTGEDREEYSEIFVGHTPIYKTSTAPVKDGNVWFMDTGAGWEGVLSVMDIDTKEFWQSDVVSSLYPDNRGRN